MHLLLRGVLLHQPGHAFHGRTCDLLIRDGRIARIQDKVDDPNAELWDARGLHVSAGWVDIGAYTMDPGQEHREDLESFARAASRGGYTHVAVFPNTEPAVDAKAQVLYLQTFNDRSGVRILPVGAISVGAAGEEIAELYDMHQAGAVAFSDGYRPVAKAGLLLRSLLYVKAIDGLVIDQPLDPTLAAKGQMHEGPVSTMLGLTGIPSLAESVQVFRNIELLDYAGSRLVLHALSSAESLAMVGAARERGLALGATVPAWNLVYTDEALLDYDTRFKLMPPLRSNVDRDALRRALADGLLDAVVTMHRPLEEDQKEVEFPYAATGAAGLETTFALLRTHLVPGHLDLDTLLDRLSAGPRRLLRLPEAKISEGEPMDLTVFDPEAEWTFRISEQASRGRNSPLDGQVLQGRVMATLAHGQVIRHF